MSRIAELEAAAKAKAVERVANLLQRPDQLEKIDEYRKREGRKKGSKEALLKTALQSQLDGVRTGLELLRSARKDLEQVGIHTSEIQKCLQKVPQVAKDLESIREESFRHSQYGMAMENMSNIFNINKNLEKAHQLLKEGNLLHAHIRLSELETSRDELLFELFRVGNKSEQVMLSDYFSDVGKLSQAIETQLTLNLKRTINAARKEPTILVTTLRIIEREEKADAQAAQRYDMSGFMPPQRPKKLREKAFKILENSVIERLEGCQLDTRSENKLWLVRYLEVMRQIIHEDLLVIKSLCVPCFPPSYNILQRYISMYHRCLSNLIQECIANGLEGNEFVSMLSWIVNTYTGPELLGSPDLGLDPEEIPSDLLDAEGLSQLTKDYLANIASNYRSWRMKTMSKEVEEWWHCPTPQQDSDGHFHTEAPIIIFQMVDENLQVAKTVSSAVVQEMLLLSLDMIREYGQAYSNEVKEFKDKYFLDRSKVQNFTQFVIAIINNCLTCIQLAHQTKDRYWQSAVGDSKAAKKIDAVLQTFEDMRNKAAVHLLDEAFLDLEPHFQELITRPWLKSREAVDTICCTLEDYFQDYKHLKEKNFDLVMTQGKNLVAKKYLSALLNKKLALKSQDERNEAGEKMVAEVRQLRSLFEHAGCTMPQNKVACPFSAIEGIAEVVKNEDLDMLSLELHSFLKHYPDLTKEQLMAILSLRGDIGRFDLKQRASEYIQTPSSSNPRGPVPQTIFSQVPVSSSLFI